MYIGFHKKWMLLIQVLWCF